ncbi:MAG: nicotinamide riboside transporter PnuC [Bacteroidales bacterium]
MLISSFFELFWQNILETTWLEVIAVIFGLLSVWYAKKANLLVYPTGIVSVLIYVYICFNFQLYADMGINFFYFVMSVYGWYMWTRKGPEKKVIPIRWNTTRQQWLGVLAVVVFFWAILGLIFLFKQDDADYMNSYIPYVDSLTTAIFLVGMLLMALKRIENWIYWIIGDIISVPLYFVKGLVFTSFQYAVFLAIAVAGLLAWKRMYEQERALQV